MKSSKPDITTSQLFWRALAMVSFGVGALACSLLAISSLMRTSLSRIGANPEELQAFGNLFNHPDWIVASFVGMAIALALLFAAKRLGRRHPRIVVALAVSFIAVIQIAWIWAQLPLASSFFSDAYQLLTYSSELVRSDFSSFQPATSNFREMQPGQQYFSCYPYQAGLLLMDVIFTKAFGDNRLLALAVTSAALNLLSVASVLRLTYSIGSRQLNKERANSLVSCFATACALCLPWYLYSSFPYAVSAGLALGILFFCCGLHSCLADSPRIKRLSRVATIVVMTVMLWVKSTYILAVTAFLIAMFIRILITKKKRDLVFPVVLLVVCILVRPLPQRYLEAWVGCSFGEGLPHTAWIAMGTSNDKTTTMPNGEVVEVEGYGWWTRYALDLLDETNNDYEAIQQASSKRVITNIIYYASHPAEGLEFLRGKYTSEWNDPTFECLYMVNLNIRYMNVTHLQSSQFFNPADTNTVVGWFTVHLLLPLMDGTQTVFYALAAIALWSLTKKARPSKGDDSIVTYAFPLSLAAVLFLEGLFVYSLWESKSQYILPFYVMVALLAAYGLFHCGQGRRPPAHAARKRIAPCGVMPFR